MNSAIGNTMLDWGKTLFPICRSITGQGVRDTLLFLQQKLPNLVIKSIPTGTQVFDWTIPQEWKINQAYIADLTGNKIVDFAENNLHVVGYSTAIDQKISRDELMQHLYSLPHMPDAIPYVTSYYQKRWGFCLTEHQKQQLTEDEYYVKIDSEHFDGELNYGELIIKGKTDKEILLSTYICHPSMANNELSGPLVTTAIAQWLSSLEKTYYSYRIIFVPETIGSICYLSQHLNHLKQHVTAGFVLTCIGDDRNYSYLSSRAENTLADQVVQHVLKYEVKEYKRYSFLARGSDERQYCAPGVDLPVCSIMRTKYGEYPEYHTSLDNFDVVTADGLAGGYHIVQRCLALLEQNHKYRVKVLCEPQLGKRGLYPTLSDMSQDYSDIKTMMNFLAYCDGSLSLLDIAEKLGVYAYRLLPIVNKFLQHDLISTDDEIDV
jgi:aminopeptidase-like protein